jgi:hypothetical protein
MAEAHTARLEVAALRRETTMAESNRQYRNAHGVPVWNWDLLTAIDAQRLRDSLIEIRPCISQAVERLKAIHECYATEWIAHGEIRPEYHAMKAWERPAHFLLICEASFASDMNNKQDARQSFTALVLSYRRLKRITERAKFIETTRGVSMLLPYWTNDDAEFEKRLRAFSEKDEMAEIVAALRSVDAIRLYDTLC